MIPDESENAQAPTALPKETKYIKKLSHYQKAVGNSKFAKPATVKTAPSQRSQNYNSFNSHTFGKAGRSGTGRGGKEKKLIHGQRPGHGNKDSGRLKILSYLEGDSLFKEINKSECDNLVNIMQSSVDTEPDQTHVNVDEIELEMDPKSSSKSRTRKRTVGVRDRNVDETKITSSNKKSSSYTRPSSVGTAPTRHSSANIRKRRKGQSTLGFKKAFQAKQHDKVRKSLGAPPHHKSNMSQLHRSNNRSGSDSSSNSRQNLHF